MGERIRHVAVLAGGKSVRMGVDKALILVDKVPMLARMVAISRDFGAVLVVGRAKNEPKSALFDPKNIQFVPDSGEIHAGPIVGVITALETIQESVLVLGCDLPLLRNATVRALLDAHARASTDTLATMAVIDGHAEPLFSVYTMRALPRLKEMVASGRKSLQGLMREPGVVMWEVPAEMREDLLNVNDPATLAEAERKLRERG